MKTPLRVLLADDDAIFIAPYLKANSSIDDGPHLHYVTSASDCTREIHAKDYDVVLLDINFGHGSTSGVEIITAIRQCRSHIKIVMLSGQDDDSTVLKCLEQGADDFLSKSIDQLPKVGEYLAGLSRERRHAEMENAAAKEIATQVGAVYVSQKMQEVFNNVMIARRNPDLPVLITGGTGVGKDLVARAISQGLGKPRVDVDCGAIPENLVESEFFGHIKGAFTGATSNKIGKFQAADGGDLFLDEIGNLKRSSQDRFLRAIQHGEITPVGSSTASRVRVRIIAATNENFDEMINSGRFRQDLLERLKGVWIEIPDLKSRSEDIEPIVSRILEEADGDLSISPTCLAILRNYEWPGNVRELESTIREMIANCKTSQLSILHLPERLKDRLLKRVRNTGLGVGAENSLNEPKTYPVTGQKAYPLPTIGGLDQVFDEFLIQYLPERFQKLGSHRSQAELAKSLGIARNTLAGYLKRLNIELPVEGGMT